MTYNFFFRVFLGPSHVEDPEQLKYLNILFDFAYLRNPEGFENKINSDVVRFQINKRKKMMKTAIRSCWTSMTSLWTIMKTFWSVSINSLMESTRYATNLIRTDVVLTRNFLVH